MSTKVPQDNSEQEIDIFQLSKSIGGFFNRISAMIFRSIYFFVHNWIIVLILVILGFGLGWFLDSHKKKFENQVIVTPNFGSVDYLYSKIDLIDSKIRENDTIFLKSVVGIHNPKELKGIEIKAIADVYNFINNKPENFELIKLMAEDGEIKKVLEENLTSKNFTYQTIFLFTNKKTSQENIIEPLLKYLNESTYFRKVQKEVYQNIQYKMKQNDTIIKQIDRVLDNFSKTASSSTKSDKLIYYNENTQLNEIIKTKNELIIEQGNHKLELISFDKTIKENSITTNLEIKTPIYFRFKILIPLLLLLFYILWSFGKEYLQKK